MKNRIVKFLFARGWYRLAYKVSPSLAHYYAAVGVADALQRGLRGEDI